MNLNLISRHTNLGNTYFPLCHWSVVSSNLRIPECKWANLSSNITITQIYFKLKVTVHRELVKLHEEII